MCCFWVSFVTGRELTKPNGTQRVFRGPEETSAPALTWLEPSFLDAEILKEG